MKFRGLASLTDTHLPFVSISLQSSCLFECFERRRGKRSKPFKSKSNGKDVLKISDWKLPLPLFLCPSFCASLSLFLSAPLQENNEKDLQRSINFWTVNSRYVYATFMTALWFMVGQYLLSPAMGLSWFCKFSSVIKFANSRRISRQITIYFIR